MVGLGRLELPTLRLSGVRSNHLSYRPMTAFGASAPGSRSHLDLVDQSEWKEKRRRRRSALCGASSAPCLELQ